MGHFKVIKTTDLNELSADMEIPESDFTIQNDNKFIQFKYHSEEKYREKYKIDPGHWRIMKSTSGLFLEPTSYAKDKILEKFVNTKNIENIVDSFFTNFHVYKEMEIDVPKRNILLYGPPGTGKTTAASVCVAKYLEDKRTAVVTWDTNALDSYDVKMFIANFEYVGVDKIIVVAEDIGGIENDGVPLKNDSSLLSLLDNSDKTFTIPVMIISTTNHPENLGAAVANRSGRFDDKIEVGYPPAEARRELLSFFSKGQADEEALKLIESTKCQEFPPSSIKEVYIRSRLRSQKLALVINDVIKEQELYKKAFTKRAGVGF